MRGRALGPAYFHEERDYKDYADALERLAQYEDIGLSPDEIEVQLETYSSVLCDVTNNKMSKTNYTLEAIRSAIQDAQDEDCDRCEYSEYLRQYEEAEESGRFVRLPFKVGDTAYMLWPCGKNGKGIAVLSVRHVDMDHTQNVVFSGIAQRGSGSYRKFAARDVGKTVFITREEAAEALKKVNP